MQVSTDLVDKKVNQCAFGLHWLLDACAGLSKRINGVVNTIATNQVLIPVKFIESYPRSMEVMVYQYDKLLDMVVG